MILCFLALFMRKKVVIRSSSDVNSREKSLNSRLIIANQQNWKVLQSSRSLIGSAARLAHARTAEPPHSRKFAKLLDWRGRPNTHAHWPIDLAHVTTS